MDGRRAGTNETILLHDDMISIGEMIGQIDLSQPGVPVPSGLPGGETPGQALHGTGFSKATRCRQRPPLGELPTTDSYPPPVLPNCAPVQEGDNPGDTKTVFPAPPQNA